MGINNCTETGTCLTTANVSGLTRNRNSPKSEIQMAKEPNTDKKKFVFYYK
jgi:hypothetical protein